MPKPHRTVANLSHAWRNPRPAPDIYQEYNSLRQFYILKTAAKHFAMRDDDPAPLFNKTLLDVGCGESTVAEFLALSGAEITAIDTKPEVLVKAKQSAEAFGAPITFLQTRAEDLIKTEQKFNIILALDLMEDAQDPAKLLWVLRQLLEPGGLIIFSSINRTIRAWFYHIFLSSYIYGRMAPGTRSFWRFYTPKQLGILCAQSGLKLTDIQGMRFSASKQKWKFADLPHTRYLAAAVAQ